MVTDVFILQGGAGDDWIFSLVGLAWGYPTTPQEDTPFMMPHFNTTTVMALAMVGVLAGIGLRELRGADPVKLTPALSALPDLRTGSGTTPTAFPVPPPIPVGNARPAIITTTTLEGFADLSAPRQRLIETALAVAGNSPWLPYVHGGADPAQGGLDCSGAMYYVLTQCGLSPPRTSAGQYEWLRDHRQLHRVSDTATTMDDPSLAGLRPGDLLFWATGKQADDGKIQTITHVAMYLGRETKDGLHIMINATDGRSYRGIKANGYGVYDFHIPHEESTSKLVGYGPPPGMTAITTLTQPGKDAVDETDS